MRRTVIFILSALLLSSCRTMDVEKRMLDDIKDGNEKALEESRSGSDGAVKKAVNVVDVPPEIVETTKIVVVPESEFKKQQEASGIDAAKQSCRESIVTLKEFIGGTSYYDYDEHMQYPVYTKMMSMTTVMLNSDEHMEESQVFISDSLNWYVTGDVFPNEGKERQILFIKPLKSGLETNLTVVTSKRIYHFVLYSISKDYQPMVEFRYPKEREFIASRTKHIKSQDGTSVIYEDADPDEMSYNYKIRIPFLHKAPEWTPEKVYDDGTRTYFQLPKVVLQKEMPGIWEGKNEIANVQTDHNLLVVDKLIEKATLRLGKQKVTVVKKKGVPVNMKEKRLVKYE